MLARVMRCVLLVGLLAACSQGNSGAPIDAAIDAARDAPAGKDAAVDAPPAGPARLILTEVVVTPNNAEYLEIANPTDETVDLSRYYLADNGTYFSLPMAAPTVDATDFIIKFPAGATIGPKAVVTVALDTAANFSARYAVAPSYSIVGGTMVTVAATDVAQLTNGGEAVVLFYWDGATDLVRDVDIMLVGVPTAGNRLIDKSGMPFDGPDADTATSTYATDARSITAQPSSPDGTQSTKRILLEAGHETQTGAGNGLDGHDETSEDSAVTWDTAFTAPTPGALPPGLLP
jgi:uncharacterized protein